MSEFGRTPGVLGCLVPLVEPRIVTPGLEEQTSKLTLDELAL